MLARFYRPEQDIRKQQINTLKVFNDNVNEITEDFEYEVLFASGGKEFRLIVTLSKEFPKEKPVLKISPLIVHPWVTSDGTITSAPGLLNFTVHSDLGRVVQAIIREFQRTPPPLINNNGVPSTVSVKADSENRTINSASFHHIQRFSPPTDTYRNLTFSELNNLSVKELQFLKENEDRQQEFIDELSPVREQNNTIDELIAQVEDMAEVNLTKQEQLQELQNSVDFRIEEVTKLAFENERLHAIYQNLSDKYAPRNIQEQLKLAAEKAEKESERIAESFLIGEIDVEKFLLDFLRVRTLCQMRKTKDEKLSHQLHSLEKAGF